MKKIYLLILFVSTIVTAQKKEFKYSLSGIQKVVLTADTSIKIEASTSQELVLSESKNDDNKHNKLSS